MATNRAILVHGWGCSPEGDWLPWLKAELERRGWQVAVPAMPDTEYPKIEPWVEALAAAAGKPDEQLVLIGHSIGCPTILHYLAGLPPAVMVAGCVLVAPWLRLDPHGVEYSEEERAIARPWLECPPDLANAAQHVAHGCVAIFSSNDYWVDAGYNEPRFRAELGARTAVLPSRGHFMERDGVTQLPQALMAAL